MHKKFNKVIATTILTTSALGMVGFTQAPAKEPAFSKLVAFGDSMSDNGSANAISTTVVESGKYPTSFIKPGELYWQNRYSNGFTAIEVASILAKLPLENYATGGATSGYHNYTDWMDSLGQSGILGQIDKYAATLKGEEADDALYFILAGANDYCMYTDFNFDTTTVGEVAATTIENFETAIRKLADLGAEDIVLSYAHDVSTMPYEITSGRVEIAKEYTETVNSVLPTLTKALEKELDVEITTFDITKVTDDITKHPKKYGFTEFVNVIQPTWPEVLPAVTENVESYMYFDEWHPSAKMHKILGEELYKTIKNIK